MNLMWYWLHILYYNFHLAKCVWACHQHVNIAHIYELEVPCGSVVNIEVI